MSLKHLITPALNDTAKTILEKRYLKCNIKGDPTETPKDLFWRVASAVGNNEAEILEFYNAMANLEFLPNTPTLINAGKKNGMLSACFVLPITDSMDGIFKTLLDSSKIFKMGGGVGYSFSNLRPKGDNVDETKGVSSGPISFMRVYNAATEEIKQGGVRRGAMMACLRVDSPDILEFITCKNDSTHLNNFNISVAITDEFMDAVKNDKDYWLINPKSKEKIKKLKAKDVFNLIIKQAYKNGEPGLLFIDTANKFNPTPNMGEYESTNPCGEQPLLPYESCNLASINLNKFISKNGIDLEKLKSIIKTCVRFLDNIIDINKFPLPEIEKITKANRKIGLGVMGWADALLTLEIRYGSKESLKLADNIMSFINKTAIETSQELAVERGEFPNFKESIYKDDKPLRNACLTTIAPTGTISMIAHASGGIEPIFGMVYTKKNILDGKSFKEVNAQLKAKLTKAGLYTDALIEQIEAKGSIQNIDGIPDDIKNIFVTSQDITPAEHVKMQAAFQKHVHSSISKTVNMPNSATEADVEKVYLLAHELGCKGVTIYRDGSRSGQILNIGKEIKPEPSTTHTTTPTIRKRPKVTEGKTYKITAGCGDMYIVINEDSKGACEVFNIIGKSGGCITAWSETTARLISLALKAGVPLSKIAQQIRGIRCPSPLLAEGGSVVSCSDGMAKAFENYMKDKKKEDKLPDNLKNNKLDFGHNPYCPSCGNALHMKEGCMSCNTCGFAKCS